MKVQSGSGRSCWQPWRTTTPDKLARLQFLEKAKEDSVKPKDGVEGGDEMEEREQEDGPSYEFNNQEATVVEVVMDSMRICALALAVQFASTFLLGRLLVLVAWCCSNRPCMHNCSACSIWARALALHLLPPVLAGEWQWQQHMTQLVASRLCCHSRSSMHCLPTPCLPTPCHLRPAWVCPQYPTKQSPADVVTKW